MNAPCRPCTLCLLGTLLWCAMALAAPGADAATPNAPSLRGFMDSGASRADADFPPFFGNDSAPAPQPTPESAPQPAPIAPQQTIQATPLEGLWYASDGRETIQALFHGNQLLFTKNGQQKMSGTFVLEGSNLHIQGSNGNHVTFVWRVQHDRLYLDDMIMIRQSGAQTPPPPPPDWQTPPAPQTYQSPLEGRWSATTNAGTLTFIFTGKQYQAFLNGRRIETGTFVFDRNQIHCRILSGQNAGQRVTNAISLDKGNLIFAMRFPDGSFSMFHRQ